MRLLRLPYDVVRIPTELALEIAKRAGGAAVSLFEASRKGRSSVLRAAARGML